MPTQRAKKSVDQQQRTTKADFGCVSGFAGLLHLVVFVVLRGFFTVNWCVLVVLMELTGFFTVNWCCFGCVDGVDRILHSELRLFWLCLPSPPRVMLTHWLWWWWWWHVVGMLVVVWVVHRCCSRWRSTRQRYFVLVMLGTISVLTRQSFVVWRPAARALCPAHPE